MADEKPIDKKLSERIYCRLRDWLFDGTCAVKETEAKLATTDLYHLLGHKAPQEIVIVHSPFEAVDLVNKRLKKENQSPISSTFAIGCGNFLGFMVKHDYHKEVGDYDEVCKDPKAWDTLYRFCESGVWDSILYDTLAVLIRRPKTAKLFSERDERGELREGFHSLSEPTIAWGNGDALYYAHNIRMPKEYIETPAEKIPAEWVLKEENVDVRRELLRKVGMERWIQQMGAKVISKQGDVYELLEIKNIPSFPRMVYLKMRNPSIGVWHVEGVHPDCSTVEQAINWRAWGDKDKKWRPAILT